MATTYGTLPTGLAPRPTKRGTAMITLLCLGVVALASVVFMVHSAGSIVDLTKVSGNAANQVSPKSGP